MEFDGINYYSDDDDNAKTKIANRVAFDLTWYGKDGEANLSGGKNEKWTTIEDINPTYKWTTRNTSASTKRQGLVYAHFEYNNLFVYNRCIGVEPKTNLEYKYYGFEDKSGSNYKYIWSDGSTIHYETSLDTAKSKGTNQMSGTFTMFFRAGVKFIFYADVNKTQEYKSQLGYAGLNILPYKFDDGTVPTGYTFDGWKNVGNDKRYTWEDVVSVNEVMNGHTNGYQFIPIFKANQYTIKLNANGASGTMDDITATYDSWCRIPYNTFTKTGYTFSGWKATSGLINDSNSKPYYWASDQTAKVVTVATVIHDYPEVKNLRSSSGTVTLTAQWKINTYTLTVNYYGGTTRQSNTADLLVTASTCNPSSSTKITSGNSAKFTHTYSTSSQTVSITLQKGGGLSYYMGLNYVPTTSSYSKYYKASTSDQYEYYSYSWTPSSNVSINIYVYQQYAISYNSNNGAGTVPSTQYKIHGTAITLGTNSLTRTSYTANGWNTSSLGTDAQYTSGETYSDNASRTLYANWTPQTCTLNVKIMTSTNGSTYTNSATGGLIWIGYKYNSNNTIVSTDSSTTNAASWSSSSVLISQLVTFSSTANSGYVFVGISTSTSAPYNVTNLSFTPISQGTGYTYYAYFNILSGNKLKYDSTDKYFYFEDGYFPQSEVEFSKEKSLLRDSADELSIYYDETNNVLTLNGNYTNNSGIWYILQTGTRDVKAGKALTLKAEYLGGEVSGGGRVVFGWDLCDSSSTLIQRSTGELSISASSSSYENTLNQNVANSYIRVYLWRNVDVEGSPTFNNAKFRIKLIYDYLSDVVSSSNEYQILSYLDANGNVQEIKLYSYNGSKYAMATKNGVTKWFNVEPIRWRVSDYGVASTDYPTNFSQYGKTYTDFKVVSDNVLWFGAVTSQKKIEGWEFDESEMAKSFASIYIKDGATLSDEKPKYVASSSEKSYYFGPAGQQQKVMYTTKLISNINIATEEEVKENLSDLRARASDMVAFILGLNEDGYCDYWTRELGNSLNNGIRITSFGISKSAWLQNFYGVRFSLRMSEGTRV